ncbi:hypothetical protein LRP52_37165 [Photobacterium sp. ZSDE20]|uniref:Uncharacterized protein n=1 Tax=Photobacterium pectinilyticum TaxID=2906793 RepID=A0ABT1N789_9GAMM|nr:hypothetical protein [Photobacterium sp. ZSDE20]MCQ1060623.1 hypothetical protein [Photobacterium sp. ZSDE20]MDD1827818.1 hypothetical protein [Photobacterium sp. ZSDE20]
MSNEFFHCIKELTPISGVVHIDTINNGGKQKSLYMEKGFFPSRGFIIIAEGGAMGSLVFTEPLTLTQAKELLQSE